MENLQRLAIAHQLLEIGRLIGRARELHDVRLSVGAAKLHETQTIAVRVEPERFRVHGDGTAEVQAFRQIAFMESDFHVALDSMRSLRLVDYRRSVPDARLNPRGN
jgi:hypothetical protein